MRMKAFKNITLLALIFTALATQAHPAAPALFSNRAYLYAAGGIGCALALPFIYHSLYFRLASPETLKKDARALLARVRSRYGSIEQVARSGNQRHLAEFVARFFEQRELNDSLLRRKIFLAPESDEYQYFHWRTEPYLQQLDRYKQLVTDAVLKHELQTAYNSLKQIFDRINSMLES